ncbi:sucrose-6-phosphate hydrolase [Lactobacillus alimentarius DSM] [Lactiplantibacillus mudanjiangensis]|uniref:sucrose-6-phosphate hydrolase n=1 Tax=Lactiplantibacillus mudanjiangensis TaxID=1296538 RepID=UPI0010142861|nr:sucrose-6-phosphate hydrolase [Lactobacillus alimentarius DSM] [Lactiplantibacillus mudanjiangensis]
MVTTTWTTAERYRPYDQWPTEQLTTLRQQIAQSHWRFGYHIQPTTGLLNDPNGFSYFNGQWHLFYQAFPYGPVHGLKSWEHLVSDDLMHWEKLGPALIPDTPLDQQGVYSGSAIAVKDRLFLMYTGNVRDQDWERHPKQNGAWLTTTNQVTKLTTPLISNPPKTVTEHFRDPQIIEHDGQYYAFIGAQTTDLTGHVMVYQAPAVTGPWTLKGDLQFSDQPMGYMVECPNLVFIDDRPVLIFCPQGVSADVLASENIYPNAYVVGQAFDWETFSFIDPSPLQNLDAGFDVYATQAFNAPDSRALAVSWIGLPDIAYPSDREGWANGLSVIKDLHLKNDRLVQQPVGVSTIRQQVLQVTMPHPVIPQQSELHFTVPADQQGQVTIVTDITTNQGLILNIDTAHGELVVDRAGTGEAVAATYGMTRTANLNAHQPLTGQLLLDHSVFELYLNDGATVLTGRMFPATNADFSLSQTGFTTALGWQGWQLESVN